MNTESLYKSYHTELFALAYRMLGSVMDAEDIIQDAFLTYDQLPDQADIQNERAFLYKMVTNRCLDLLRSSAKKRELYVGPWLPEPLVEQGAFAADPSETYLQQESISTAYLLLLQQLNAVERAVFLLREIFHYSYDEIAEMVDKSSANCRQIFHRAKKSMHFEPEQNPSILVAEVQVQRFVDSLLQGNREQLLKLVSEDVVIYSDGGGKVRAARIPISGFENVINFSLALFQMYEGKYSSSYLTVNGAPAIEFVLDDGTRYVYSFAFSQKQIRTIYVFANPDKLRHF